MWWIQAFDCMDWGGIHSAPTAGTSLISLWRLGVSPRPSLHTFILTALTFSSYKSYFWSASRSSSFRGWIRSTNSSRRECGCSLHGVFVSHHPYHGTLLQCQSSSDSESACFVVDALSIFRHHVHGGVWTDEVVLGRE